MKKVKFSSLNFDTVETLTKEQQVSLKGGTGYGSPSYNSNSTGGGGEPYIYTPRTQFNNFGDKLWHWAKGRIW